MPCFSEIQTLPSSPPGIPRAGDRFHYNQSIFSSCFLTQNIFGEKITSTQPLPLLSVMPQIPRGKMILGGGVGIHRWYGMDASWKLLETGHLEVPQNDGSLGKGGLRLNIWPFLVSVLDFWGVPSRKLTYPTKREKENHGLKSTGW